MFGRTFNLLTGVSRKLSYYLTDYLGDDVYDKVILVVHSKGGIVAASAIEELINNRVDITKLEVYTFGSASDSFLQIVDNKNGLCYPFYEHFANEEEYIAQIGTLHWKIPGNVFTNKRKGHLLGEHYLPDFQKGLYQIYYGLEDSKSRLFSYVNGEEENKSHAPSNSTLSTNFNKTKQQ
eukprot:TRINITY_DN7097_c0_g1_i1.p1 TRINITY_DN7097_c0_g1~~TRINITY_DN7097_c0_g1_i1.p1  ORF type:complete len:179 (+),score=36.24 TRINITY_DN7097_c0_g1_i1:495-1031(+)